MALRPEKKQIDYQSQIGVTRGRGFQAMASASQQSADALDSISEAYATRSLEYIKEEGKNLGETAAENAQFVDQEISYTKENGQEDTLTVRNVIKPYKPVTKSEQDAYERNIAQRYVDENFVEIVEQQNNLRIEALANNSASAGFAIIAEKKMRAALDSGVFPNNVKALLETKVSQRLVDDIAAVESNYQSYIRGKVKDDYEERIDVALGSAFQGEALNKEVLEIITSDPNFVQSDLDKIRSYEYIGKILNRIQPDITGDETPEQRLEKLGNQNTDLQKIDSMVAGNYSSNSIITFSDGSKLSVSDFNSNVPSLDDRIALKTRTNSMVTSVNREVIDLQKENKNASNLNAILAGNTAGFSNADFNNAYDYNNPAIKADFEQKFPNQEYTEIAATLHWYTITEGKLPPQVVGMFENAVQLGNYGSNNDGLTNPLMLQIINKLVNTDKVVRTIDSNGKEVLTLKPLNFLGNSNLSLEAQNAIIAINGLTTSGLPAAMIEQTLSYSETVDEKNNRLSYYHDKINSDPEMQAVVLEVTQDYINDLGSDITVSAASLDFVDNILKRVQAVLAENFDPSKNIKKKDIVGFVKETLKAVDHVNSDYGSSDMTLGRSLKSGKPIFVKHPAEKQYGLPDDPTAKWIDTKIIGEAQASQEYIDSRKRLDFKFRDNLKLLPLNSSKPIIYGLYFKPKNDIEWKALTKEDGNFIQIDYSEETNKRRNKGKNNG